MQIITIYDDLREGGKTLMSKDLWKFNSQILFLKKPVKEWGETQSKYAIAGFRG